MKRIELTHDIIAEKVWEILPPEKQELLKVQESIRSRSKEYIEKRAGLADKFELNLWKPFIEELETELNEIEKDYLRKSEEAYEDKLKKIKKINTILKRRSWGLATVATLLLIALAALYFTLSNTREKKNKLETNQKAIQFQQKIDQATSRALELKDHDRTLSYRLINHVIELADQYHYADSSGINYSTATKLKDQLIQETRDMPFYRAKRKIMDSEVEKIVTLPLDSLRFYILANSKGRLFASIYENNQIKLVDSSVQFRTTFIRDITPLPERGHFRLLCDNQIIYHLKIMDNLRLAFVDSIRVAAKYKKYELDQYDHMNLLPNDTVANIFTASFDVDNQIAAYRQINNRRELFIHVPGKGTYTIKAYYNKNEDIVSFNFLPRSINGSLLVAWNRQLTFYDLHNQDTTFELKSVHREFNRGGDIKTFCFSNDGRYLLVGKQDGAIQLFKWRSNRYAEDKRFYAGQSAVTALAFTPDGEYFLIGDSKGDIKIWDVQPVTLESIPPLLISIDEGNSSPTFENLVVGGCYNSRLIYALKGQLDQKILERGGWSDATTDNAFEGKGIVTISEVIDIQAFPGQRYLLSLTRNGVTRLWTNDGQFIWPKPSKRFEISRTLENKAACMSISNQYFAVAGGEKDSKGNILLFTYEGVAGMIRPESVKMINKWKTETPITSIAISKAGHIFAGSQGGDIYIFNKSGERLRSFPKSHEGAISYLSFTPNEKFLVSVGTDNVLLAWVNANDPENFDTSKRHAHDVEISAAKVNPNEPGQLLIGDVRGILTLYDVTESGFKASNIIYAHGGSILAINFMEYGHKNYMITGSIDDESIRFWNVKEVIEAVDRNTALLGEEVNEILKELKLQE